MYAAFVISSITEDNPIGDKIDANNVQLLEQLLNSRLQLSTYGQGLKGIAAVFLGTAPEDEVHEEESSYAADSQELYLQLRLPYAQLEQASEAEVLHMMARRYWQGLQKSEELQQLPNFAAERLVQDVANLFIEAGGMTSDE